MTKTHKKKGKEPGCNDMAGGSVAKHLNPKRDSTVGSTLLENSIRKDTKLIDSYMQSKDVPKWFRGTSVFQSVAMLSLFNALRDDTEQRTTHRVRRCLANIGIDPVINAKQAKQLMRLSRGNDLAFLYFLLELHYKTKGSDYSVNEQLILSTISHLDMITTLRELDKILPPGQPTKKEIERQKRLEEKKKTEKIKKKRKKLQYISPYFEKQVRPKLYGKPLTADMPDFEVKFGFYNFYKNKNYVVPNESNRWYEDYVLMPSKRIARKIIHDEINQLFDDQRLSILKEETIKSLCEHHKVVNDLQASLEAELKMIARDRCLEYIDVKKHRQNEARKRMREQLDQDVGMYICEFRKMCAKSRKQCIVTKLSNDCGGFDYLFEQVSGSRSDIPCEMEDVCSSLSNCNIETESSAARTTTGRLTGGGIGRGIGGGGDASSENKSQTAKIPLNNMVGDGPKPPKGRVSIASQGSEKRDSQQDGGMSRYDHESLVSPTPSQTFFRGPLENEPHMFDYRKIFRFKNRRSAESINIRRTFVEQIDEDIARLLKAQEANNVPLDMDMAINSCVNKMVKEGIKKKNAELEEEERKKAAVSTFMKDAPKYYDPDDRKLMVSMLEVALKKLAENPRYVLASLPDAHKLPFLKEWIAHRYGKMYTKEQRYKSFAISLKIFKALDQVTLAVPLPKVNELGTNLFVDYSCHDYLIKKANYIKKQYYRRLDAAVMEQSRTFWFALRAYLCSNGPPKNTFFAYAPARVVDINHFRIWKPTEFMNAKAEWERRRYSKDEH